MTTEIVEKASFNVIHVKQLLHRDLRKLFTNFQKVFAVLVLLVVKAL